MSKRNTYNTKIHIYNRYNNQMFVIFETPTYIVYNEVPLHSVLGISGEYSASFSTGMVRGRGTKNSRRTLCQSICIRIQMKTQIHVKFACTRRNRSEGGK